MTTFKPHLSATYEEGAVDFSQGWLLSPKYDGIRMVNIDGTQAVSRSLKPLPSLKVQELFGGSYCQHLDGEIISGSPTAPDVFSVSSSATRKVDSDAPLTLYVFDYLQDLQAPAYVRQTQLLAAVSGLPDHIRQHIVVVPQIRITSQAEFERYTGQFLDEGYEGVMLRHPGQPYKQGRSTLKDLGLIKVKERVSSEAVILRVEPEMENTNEAYTNELGNTSRSSAAEGKVAKEKVGRFWVRDISEGSPTSGMEFYVGVMRGVTAEQRVAWWAEREDLVGKILTYDHFPIGMKDAPRQPVGIGAPVGEAKGLRDDYDM